MLYLRGSVYWTQFKLRGKRIRLSTGEATRPRAVRAERILKARAEGTAGDRGAPGRPASTGGLLRDLAGEQLEDVEGRHRAPPYIASLKTGWKHLLGHFGQNARPDQVTFDRIRTYELARRRVGIRGQSIRRELWQLRHALTSAKRKGWVDQVVEFPDVDNDPPHPTRRGRLISPVILDQVLARLDVDARDRLVVASHTGLRATELLRLTGAWLEGKGGIQVLRIPAEAAKNRKERVVSCPSRAAVILEHRAKTSKGPLFPVASHKSQLRRVARELGLASPPTLRDLRTTYASLVLHATGDAAAVQDALGHHDLKMTQVYQRSTLERLHATGKAIMQALEGATTTGPQPRRRTA